MRRFFILAINQFKKSQLFVDMAQAIISYPADTAIQSFNEHHSGTHQTSTQSTHSFFATSKQNTASSTAHKDTNIMLKKNLR